MSRTAVVSRVILVAAFLIVFRFCAPWEACSMAVWAGLTGLFIGLCSLLLPWRFLGISTRRQGLVWSASALVVGAIGLLWPAPEERATASGSRLDAILPAYHFVERHAERVQADAARTRAVMKDVTFGELKVYNTLMGLRARAVGREAPALASLSDKKLIETITRPGSNFRFIEESEREWDGGMDGSPWGGAVVKVAFNLKVTDLGGGLSEVSTETRIRALDEASRRTMARYWRVIYPGSGLIRRMWLRAVRDRAEVPR
jgi:hypothetical protein